MNAREAARRTAARLEAARVPDAAFEGELLVRLSAGLDRATYFTDPKLSCDAALLLRNQTRERLLRKPYAYIAGTREFYGRDFAVTPDVLIPRPETELLVDLGVGIVDREGTRMVADVGTGSGCVAITIERERPGTRVIASDISRPALAVAALNAHRIGASIQFVRSDLGAALRPSAGCDLIVANLPYIPTSDLAGLEPEVRDWEPRRALTPAAEGGESADGLELIRALVADCAARLRPRHLLLEVAAGQAGAVAALGAGSRAAVSIHRDLADIDRVVQLTWA